MHLSVPKQVYGDLVSNGRINSLVHGIVPLFGFGLAVARFFARITTFALMINEHAINVKHFLRKIVKPVEFTRKFAKNVKTSAILANVAFFVNVFCKENCEKFKLSQKIFFLAN